MDWKKEYSIGINEIDSQHMSLVDMITRLEKCEKGKNVTSEMRKVIFEIVEYTKYHFKSEEEFMLKIRYPRRGLHKILHEELIDKVIAVLHNLKDGKELSSEDLLEFLRAWLKDHIIQEDLKIGKYYFEEYETKD